MTAHELAEKLLKGPNIEVGYFDSEGHWCTASGLRRTEVDAINWHPIGDEPQTGDLRHVIEIQNFF